MNLRRFLSFRWLVALLALIALALASVATYQRGLFPRAVHRTIEAAPLLESPVVVGLGTGLILLGWALVTKWMKVETDSPGWLSEYRLEESERQTTVADRDLMEAFEARAKGGQGTEDPFQQRLRGVLVAAYAREFGSRDEAEAYIDEGQWTSEVHAGAYLSSTGAVDYPWLHRLYAWLYPGQAYQQRISRTLHEVERACDDRLASYTLSEVDDPGPGTLLERVRSKLRSEADGP